MWDEARLLSWILPPATAFTRWRGPILEIPQPRQYLRITSRSGDVLPPQLRWLSMSSGLEKGRSPRGSSALFAFGFPAELCVPFAPSASASRPFKRKMEKEEELNRLPISPPAAAVAQRPPAPSRPFVLRRAVSPACPSRQGCSVAVASVRPLGGPGGVFEKK